MFNSIKIMRDFLFVLLLLCFQCMSTGFSEEVKFSEVAVIVQCSDEDEGTIYVALHDNEKTFPKKGSDAAYLAKAKISMGQVKIIFSKMPYGTYAVSAFYDENENGKLDYNFLGIPKERAGVSNDYSGLPKWEKSKVAVKSLSPLKITIDLQK
jgi:uncharacterized protein (DUF2141 family)